ncbi:MAG TPA: hypothetical protein PLB92_11030 [Rhodoglobus sp.]|nr:hypothetical protein [Rhodoglobus sp.]
MIPGMPYDPDRDLLAGLFHRDPPELRGFTITTQGKKDTDMAHDTLSSIRARAAAARAEASRLEATARELEYWGDEDPLSDGNVITWVEDLRGSKYTYVAVRCDGRYYITGAISTSYRWEDLVAHHLRKSVGNVWRVTQYEELTPDAG